MTEKKKNTLSSVIMSVGGSFIVLLLGVIAYYTQQDHETNKQNSIKLDSVTETVIEVKKDNEFVEFRLSSVEDNVSKLSDRVGCLEKN